jgi:hypothetical protein
MGRYHGKDLQVYMSITAAGAAVPVVGITAWTFDGATDKADATASSDSNKIQVVGLPNANGSFTFVWDDTDDTLFDAADSGEAVRVYLYRDAANAATVYRYGTAYVDISEDANITSAVSGSGTFSAAAAWGRKP